VWGAGECTMAGLYSGRRIQNYTAVRTFFADLQEWGVIPPRFDPYRSLTPPRSVKALVSLRPRIIADDVWAKLYGPGSMLHRRTSLADATRMGKYIPSIP